MTNESTEDIALRTHFSQSAEIDRLKELTLAHLKLKATLCPLGLCRALGEQPTRAGSNTIRDLPTSIRRTLTALEQEGLIEIKRVNRYTTRITLAEVRHG